MLGAIQRSNQSNGFKDAVTVTGQFENNVVIAVIRLN